jgi:hypothetical protein
MSLFIIEKDRFLYGSKSYTATEIINFTKKSKDKCDKNNIPHFKDINEYIKKIGNPNLKIESNILFYFDKKIIEYNKKECLKSLNNIGMIMV